MKQWKLCACIVAAVLTLSACGSAPAESSVSDSPASEPSVSQSSSPESVTAEDFLGYSFTFDVPEGFTQADASGSGVSEMYKAEDGSTITVVLVENDGSLASDVTEDALVPYLEQGFSQQIGTEISLEDVSFETTDIDGCPAYRLSYTLNLNGVTMNQTVIGANGDMAYTFTFTDVSGNWAEAFEASIDSLTAIPA